jgi:HEAT repeat protein
MPGLSKSLGRPNAATIDGLIAAIREEDATERMYAREELAAIGRPAIAPLIGLLDNQHPHVRWEAVKALGNIGDPAVAPALVDALDDEDGDVRWLAARGLIDLGLNALQPLLAALAYRLSSSSLLEGARHAIYRLYWRGLLPDAVKPVLVAINGPMPEIGVHAAAYAALNALRTGATAMQGDTG